MRGDPVDRIAMIATFHHVLAPPDDAMTFASSFSEDPSTRSDLR